ncbi:MlaD family protein [Aeromicrobium ginsengisoli]|uniref:MCE family protein n=1 Tax=Aeromicrobium ginsengisoli TaxID=363867 RepID=A0A5M4FAK5_9ACTN|nr:MlaD family protein [Aeromicrobium ginsengisoli]KAA1394241.1 MCE family protein [Aeromicrobium ginsengisoli]
MSGVISSVRHMGTPLARRGIALILVLTVIMVGLAFKNQIKVALRSGETISAEFADADGLVKDKSKVKLAGLKVGVVTGIEHRDDGSAVVQMKVEESALRSLGSEPEARIEPLTILGGEYSVELANGGTGQFDSKQIPVARTGTPVELDRILEALPTETREATRGVVSGLSDTLDKDGRQSLRDLSDVAPPVLRGADTFLTAAQGTNPESDLQNVVGYLQDAAAVLSEQRTAVDGALTGLDTTSAALARSSTAIGRTIDLLPAALDNTDQGLGDLQVTLAKLEEMTDKLEPTAREAKDLIDALDPFVTAARPVVAKLPPITRDAIPTVRQLIPTVTSADGFIGDIGGQTIKKVRGPILDTLSRPWNGKDAGAAEYAKSGTGIQANNKYYEEIAYMVTNLGRAVMTQDQQGSLLNFQAGVGLGSVAPISLEEALGQLIPQINGAGD